MGEHIVVVERPKGSQGVDLQQQAVTNYLLVTAPAAAPLPIDLKQYLNNPCGPANPVDVEDTGLNTNPERFLQIYHWNTAAEIPLVAAGAPGQLNLGAAVAAGMRRRIREVTVRHAGSANTVVTI